MKTQTTLLIIYVSISALACGKSLDTESTRKASIDSAIVYSHSYDEVILEGTAVRQNESKQGILNREVWNLAARPYSKSSISGGYVYDEGSHEHYFDDRIERYYEIRKQQIPSSDVEQVLDLQQKPLKWSENIAMWMEEEESTDRIISLQFRDFDEWNIPLRPPKDILSEVDYLEGISARENAIRERQTKFANKVHEVRGFGINVISDNWISGSVLVELNQKSLSEYIRCCSDQLIDIQEQETNLLNACVTTGTCSNPYASATNSWRLGQNRMAFRTNADAYHARGWTGERSNPSRHSWNDITTTVLDEYFEDESPGFLDFSSVSRIKKRWICSGGACAASSSINDSGSQGGHGTTVASIIGADYQDNQANGFVYNDPCYMSSMSDQNHCNDWEDVSSGMAPESGFVLIAAPALSDGDLASAIGSSISDGTDVYTQSVSSGTTNCDVTSSLVHEDTAENAFDDGVLVVNSITNTGTDPLTDCGLSAPSDTPKIISVNAIARTPASCTSNYSQCGFGDGRRGGVDLTIGSTLRQEAFSGVGLAAPGGVQFHTVAADGTEGDIGFVQPNVSGAATSWATPHVAGGAVLIKDAFLAGGHSWVNSPGRLAAILLAMADRGRGAGGFSTSGVDRLFGFGRLKLRTMAEISGGWGMWTKTFTASTPNYIKNPFGSTPLRSGTDFLKCVMFEAEDMSSKSNVGDRWLRVYKSDPVGGSCPSTPSGVNQSFLGSDGSFDLRHMVSSTLDLSGSCVHFEIVNTVSIGAVMTNTYCYYGNNNDSWIAP